MSNNDITSMEDYIEAYIAVIEDKRFSLKRIAYIQLILISIMICSTIGGIGFFTMLGCRNETDPDSIGTVFLALTFVSSPVLLAALLGLISIFFKLSISYKLKLDYQYNYLKYKKVFFVFAMIFFAVTAFSALTIPIPFLFLIIYSILELHCENKILAEVTNDDILDTELIDEPYDDEINSSINSVRKHLIPLICGQIIISAIALLVCYLLIYDVNTSKTQQYSFISTIEYNLILIITSIISIASAVLTPISVIRKINICEEIKKDLDCNYDKSLWLFYLCMIIYMVTFFLFILFGFGVPVYFLPYLPFICLFQFLFEISAIVKLLR